MMELISANQNFNFLGKSKFAFPLSLLLVLGSIYVWYSLGEKRYGVDYKGGYELIVQAPQGNSDSLGSALSKAGFEEPIVQAFEAGSGEFSVRLGQGDNEDPKVVKDRVEQVLKKDFGETSSIKKTDYVGPTVGKELRQRGLIAIALSLLGILAYISFRFDFAFALGAVVALFHDVIVTTGIYLFTGHTLTMGTLAAALTIVGYSVNDTIVIFDRVREEISKQKRFRLSELVNKAINITISRTIITHLLTLFSVTALLIFGGGAIRELSMFLFVGIICGTYSTIYIASPVAIAWHRYRGGRDEIE